MRNDKIAILVKRAALQFDKMSNPVFAEYDLTAAQYRVMKYLYSRPDRTVRIVDIEKECSITHPTALGILDNLSKKGFAGKVANPEDARSKVISLTDHAREMEAELDRAGDRLEDMMTENLTDGEKKELLRLLQKLLRIESEGERNGK